MSGIELCLVVMGLGLGAMMMLAAFLLWDGLSSGFHPSEQEIEDWWKARSGSGGIKRD